MKKYEFTGETMKYEGHTLRRIRYLFNFGSTMKGDVGGWIEGEQNLSHRGKCRVKDEAKVFGHARITEYAIVAENAVVKDNAQIKGESYICNHAIVGADSIIIDDTWVRGSSKVFFYANSNYGQPNISGNSYVSGHSIIEATGSIKDAEIHNASLFGELNMNNG